uniref:Peptidase M3A/M3B catalytic domain-containing protein n=1 Tax=Eutreptiella gymnastica TaxID=73025 RepID=A0A7S4G0I0_9EUGL
MALGEPYTTAALSQTKGAMEAFLRDPARLAEAEEWLAKGEGTAEQRKCLQIFVRTFKCYQMSDAEAVALRDQCTAVEDALSAARNHMRLGYEAPGGGGFVERSSVQLRTAMRTNDDEAVRKAAWEGLRSIGPFVLDNGLCEMVRLRNEMARRLGYEDFYDYKVQQAEGFSKVKLFSILDTLLEGTDALLASARERLAAEKGMAALEPWNTGYMMAGDIEKQLDPYFPFETALATWGECFAKLGISYRGATMTLDLLDRKGKYSNGFCHWPQPAWVKPDGTWQPSTTNFTSLADPAAVGSGRTALVTLMHEAGHAAHFANIVQPSPLFSQERAPTSVAYAETQSMFLDSLCKDAAWRGRYARSRDGAVLPWELHAADITATHPYEVFQLRAMLCVPYFEKALYELPAAELTPDRIQALADSVERQVQGGASGRPLLSIPHIISDEASCYYHGYVLAEMAVYQTRAHFLRQGPIVDNPEVGRRLREAYWDAGNSAMYLDLVEGLTGAPLTGAAWIAHLNADLEGLLKDERQDYDAAVAARAEPTAADVDLDMRVIVADGNERIADSKAMGGFLPACEAFKTYVRGRFFA